MTCPCGHPWDAHGFVPGFQCSPDTSITIDGVPHRGLPDVWVCGGGRLADVNDPDVSPWDFVCGCVLHSPPPVAERAFDEDER